jgi:hypothetical protein
VSLGDAEWMVLGARARRPRFHRKEDADVE